MMLLPWLGKLSDVTAVQSSHDADPGQHRGAAGLAQVGRQRREILQLQRAGISTATAELLLGRMLAKIEGLSAERDRLKAEQGGPTKGRVLGGRSW
jgi:hypothetical protein